MSLTPIITSRLVHLEHLSVYKAIPSFNNCETSVTSYNSACFTADVPASDWRALYTQFHREHVLGTIPYRWESEATEARLVKVTFDALNVIVLDGELFHDGAVSGLAKARAVKEHLGLDQSKPVMAALGEQHKVALVRETATDWELVISHELLRSLRFSEEMVADFKRHPQLPITNRWRQVKDGVDCKWESWNDTALPAKVTELIPDLSLAFLNQTAQ